MYSCELNHQIDLYFKCIEDDEELSEKFSVDDNIYDEDDFFTFEPELFRNE